MRRQRRTWGTYAGLGLVALLLVGALSAYGLQAHATADPTPQDGQNDQAVVTTYFAILNAGMQSGDFSALATVYAPDATLTQSTPKGVTTVYSGIDAIIAWYQAFQARAGAIHFTQDSMRSLAPHVVVSYEHAGKPTYVAPGRCMHVFTLKGGLIETVDWATFYGGQPA